MKQKAGQYIIFNSSPLFFLKKAGADDDEKKKAPIEVTVSKKYKQKKKYSK